MAIYSKGEHLLTEQNNDRDALFFGNFFKQNCRDIAEVGSNRATIGAQMSTPRANYFVDRMNKFRGLIVTDHFAIRIDINTVLCAYSKVVGPAILKNKSI